MKKAKKYERLHHFYPNLERKVRDTLKRVRGSSSEIGGAEIDRIFDVLEDPEKKLCWMVGKCSEEEMASWIVSMLETKKGPKLFAQLQRPRMGKDVTVLTGVEYEGVPWCTPPGGLEKLASYNKIVKEKHYDTFLDDLYHSLSNRMRNASCGYSNWLDTLIDQMGKHAHNMLLYEKIDAFNLGLTVICMNSVDVYIRRTTTLIAEALFKLIMQRYLTSSEIEVRLSAVLDRAIALKRLISDAVACENDRIPFQQISNPIGCTHSNPAAQAITNYITFALQIDEIKSLDNCLESEYAERPAGFDPPPAFTHERISEYDTDRAYLMELLGKEKLGGDDYNNYRLVADFARLFNNQFHDISSYDNVFLVYGLFYELIKNKAHLKNRSSARTIAKNIQTEGKMPFGIDYVFINKKIERSFFIVSNRMRLYPLYNKIVRTCLETALDFYLLPADHISYKYTASMFINYIRVLKRVFYPFSD